jgi:hypothetical protein
VAFICGMPELLGSAAPARGGWTNAVARRYGSDEPFEERTSAIAASLAGPAVSIEGADSVERRSCSAGVPGAAHGWSDVRQHATPSVAGPIEMEGEVWTRTSLATTC